MEMTDTAGTFDPGLLGLYELLANADPLAAAREAGAASGAGGLLTAFGQAQREQRGRWLLRALDEAIAALEVAAQLADDYAGVPTYGPLSAPPPNDTTPLGEAYSAFVAAQPEFQSLYLYRNVLARQLETPPAPSAEQRDARTRA